MLASPETKPWPLYSLRYDVGDFDSTEQALVDVFARTPHVVLMTWAKGDGYINVHFKSDLPAESAIDLGRDLLNGVEPSFIDTLTSTGGAAGTVVEESLNDVRNVADKVVSTVENVSTPFAVGTTAIAVIAVVAALVWFVPRGLLR